MHRRRKNFGWNREILGSTTTKTWSCNYFSLETSFLQTQLRFHQRRLKFPESKSRLEILLLGARNLWGRPPPLLVRRRPNICMSIENCILGRVIMLRRIILFLLDLTIRIVHAHLNTSWSRCRHGPFLLLFGLVKLSDTLCIACVVSLMAAWLTILPDFMPFPYHFSDLNHFDKRLAHCGEKILKVVRFLSL